MSLNSGANGYSGSMAQAIESAFVQAWPGAMGTAAPEMNEQVRMLFVSIAKGVVQHITSNPSAFDVWIEFGGINYKCTVTINGN